MPLELIVFKKSLFDSGEFKNEQNVLYFHFEWNGSIYSPNCKITISSLGLISFP